MTKQDIALMWFRADLRLSDNPAFFKAASHFKCLPIFIFDDSLSADVIPGSASKLWLYHSLDSLNKSLDGKLNFYHGNPKNIIMDIVDRFDIKSIYCNSVLEPEQLALEKALTDILTENGLNFNVLDAQTLWHPTSILKDDKTPYKVFTPFYKRGALAYATPPRAPISRPKNIDLFYDNQSLHLKDLNLLPTKDWYKELEKLWHIGEDAAQKRFDDFIKSGLKGYKEGRNYPSLDNVSRLSPHLHFGEISANQVWHKIQQLNPQTMTDDIAHFLSELGWREFSYYLLYYFPDLRTKNFQTKFDKFPWHKNDNFLKAWQRGKTGYPIVDAGMRELYDTGYMHNRLRMIVGSFLVKNLLLDWREGERWFWEHLLDADLANNSASWQWVAGSGADAAPYFRIFNPITQGEKFDKSGKYTRRFVPELAKLPDKYLFKPWEAPKDVLDNAGVILGKNYPHPIVNLSLSREKALDAFKKC